MPREDGIILFVILNTRHFHAITQGSFATHVSPIRCTTPVFCKYERPAKKERNQYNALEVFARIQRQHFYLNICE